jgi:hypothetical protein
VRARGEGLAHAFEFRALVEKAARPEPRGEAPVGLGGEAGQDVNLDLRRRGAHGAQHVEAAALGEVQVEDHDVRAIVQDFGDRLCGARRDAHDARVRDILQQLEQARAHQGRILDEINGFHGASVAPGRAAHHRRRRIRA